VLVDHREELDRTPVVGAFGDEVVGPDVVAVLGAQADARSVGKPQAAVEGTPANQ